MQYPDFIARIVPPTTTSPVIQSSTVNYHVFQKGGAITMRSDSPASFQTPAREDPLALKTYFPG